MSKDGLTNYKPFQLSEQLGYGMTVRWVEVFFGWLLIAVVAEFTGRRLHYLRRSASRSIERRLARGLNAAVKLGVHTEHSDVRGQLAVLEKQTLGFIGRLRYLRVRKRLLDPTPESVLRSHSRRAYLSDVISQFLDRIISIFRPFALISLANLRILLFSGIFAAVINHQIAHLRLILIHIREVVPWHSIAGWLREWYTLVALVLVALIVATRSPLVDRVRARDEAAKDANRLLAQLYGRLSEVQRCAAIYTSLIEKNRAVVVADAVEKASNGVYTWTYGGGLALTGLFRPNLLEGWFSNEANRLEEACKELSDHLAGYRRVGLHTVASRLTSAVFLSLFECCISFSSPEQITYLRTRLLLDLVGRENVRIRSALETMIEAEREGDDGTRQIFRTQADNSIRVYACSLDEQLATAYTIIFHLNHINAFLNRRLHGNARTRLASSLVR